MNRNDPVPAKPVACMSFGGRVRIARLYQSYEELLDKVIRNFLNKKVDWSYKRLIRMKEQECTICMLPMAQDVN